MSPGNCRRNYHLQAIPTADPSIRDAALTSVDRSRRTLPGISAGAGQLILLKDTGQESLARCALSPRKFRNSDCRERIRMRSGDKFPAGSWILADQPGLHDAVRVDRFRTRTGLHRSRECARRSASQSASCRASACGFRGPTRTRSDGFAIRSISAKFLTRICATKIFAREICIEKVDVLLYGHVDLELAEQIEGLPKTWSPMPFKKTPQTPSFGTPAESDDITGGIGYEGLAQIQHFIDDGGLMVTLGSGSMLALEGGLVRFVRRSSGGVPRSAAGGGGSSSAASQQAATRTPGAHVRVTFDRPDHPIATDIPPHLGLPPEFSALQHAPPLAAHGVLHHLPGWSRRSQRHRHGVGRQPRTRISSSAVKPGEKRI